MAVGRRWAAAVMLVALALGACGGGGGTSSLSGADIGSSSAAGAADRVVEIKMLPTDRFDPDTVDVKVGETVTFRLVNQDDTFHEFMIADEKTHQARDKEMAAMGSEPMTMADRPNTITVAAGQTEELTWTFPKAGTVIFGCHEPGRYAAGMRGTINVS